MVLESSDVLVCSRSRDALCGAACWPAGEGPEEVMEEVTECTIWIPPMGIIGNGERT